MGESTVDPKTTEPLHWSTISMANVVDKQILILSRISSSSSYKFLTQKCINEVTTNVFFLYFVHE